ncbi:wd repeat-containing protein 92, partial [Nannochloropsis gaditana CCMP526]|uniref:wd repeat-containing protein 92 n=1 Tax=Nannochloropsis gaditana (strain CCMP526) TaxID=1093141 RepID=UPI00029F5EAC
MVNIKDGPQFIPHTQTNLSYTPHDVKWIPCSARLVSVGATATGKGKLEIYALSGGALKKTAETVHAQSLRCATFGAATLEERKLATGDWNGDLCV